MPSFSRAFVASSRRDGGTAGRLCAAPVVFIAFASCFLTVTILLVTEACDRIRKICVLRTEDNGPFIDTQVLPPIFPSTLVKTRPGDFLRQVCSFKFRLEHRYAVDHVDVIADEHRALIMHYRSDEVLKQSIDSIKSTASFSEAWSVIGKGSFQNLAEFCGVIATLFAGTCTVESDFSILMRWEKDDFRKSLSDFGLEAVLQAKQHLLIEKIL